MSNTRYTTRVNGDPRVSYVDLVDWLASREAPAGATDSQIRGIASLFVRDYPVMKNLADGLEVDADELLAAIHTEMDKTQSGQRVDRKALQAMVNWLVVGGGRPQEIRTI